MATLNYRQKAALLAMIQFAYIHKAHIEYRFKSADLLTEAEQYVKQKLPSTNLSVYKSFVQPNTLVIYATK